MAAGFGIAVVSGLSNQSWGGYASQCCKCWRKGQVSHNLGQLGHLQGLPMLMEREESNQGSREQRSLPGMWSGVVPGLIG